MNRPLISVIIPIYNTSKYLEETLVSILNQSMLDDIEVLMIDDGSSDDSRYIIEKYALDYDNFHAFHKENEGQGIARNYGLDLAKGEYIHFLDSDDYLVSEAYEKLYNLAISDNYDFVVGNVLRFNRYNCWEDQLFKKSFKGLNGNHEFKSINEHPALVWDTITCNKLYKKSFLDKNNIRFPNKKIFYEDLLFSIETYIKSDSFCFFDGYFYYWRLRQDSSSVTQNTSLAKNFKDRLEIILAIKELLISDLNSQTLNKLYEKWLLHDIKMFAMNFNDYDRQYYDELLDEILEIIKDVPLNIKDGLTSYHKIIYKMIENNDIESLLYFAPLEDTLKKDPNFKLDLNENYLKLIDFDKDGAEEEFKASIVNIDNDENNLLIEFQWNIDYLDDINPNIKSLLVDENNREYPLDIRDNNIILPVELLTNKKQIKIKMICRYDSFRKESYLKNYRRRSFNFNDINLEIGIGINSILCINSRNVCQKNIIIDDISFDGRYFIFEGCSEFKIRSILLENVINFTKFTYPVNFNHCNFNFKIPYSDIVRFPIKKWELKGDYLIKLAKSFSFFRNHDEIIFSNQRNIVLIEDDIYDIFERLNKLNDNLNSVTQKNQNLTNHKDKLKNGYVVERYEKYEIEEKLRNEIKSLKRKNKALKKEVKRTKKESNHFKSSKAYRLWQAYANLDDEKDIGKPKTKKLKDIKVALISDQFTYESFKYEFDAISLEPEKWKRQFVKEKPDIFFCESAWKGHNFKGVVGPWEDKIRKNYNTEDENRKILLDILDFCRQNDIPTVFWNKEDPVHYRNENNSFAETAKEFDYIFTSSKETVERYKTDFGHPNVNILMFAGQPKMFNPLNLSNETINEIVFAGSYYLHHPERMELMDYIFDMLIENGQTLLIYDRQQRFNKNDYPQRFKKYVVPPVPFREIPNIYKKMNWGLNFNIVVDSESMFARRVFELSLSYVNIITNYSLGVEKIFGDNVFVFDKEDDLPDFNEDYEEKRLNNLYNVLENHTYAARWKQILDTIGFKYAESKNDISVIFKLNDVNEIDGIINQFNSIEYDDKILKILLGKGCNVDIDEVMRKYPVIDSISFKKRKLKIKTQYFIVIDGNIDSDFIKKGILHYQYLNKRVSICEGEEKFRLGIESTIENKTISKVNRKYLRSSDLEIEVYYI